MTKRKEYTTAEKIKWCEENMQYSLDKINYHQKRYNRFKKILDNLLNNDKPNETPPTLKTEVKAQENKRFNNLELEEED